MPNLTATEELLKRLRQNQTPQQDYSALFALASPGVRESLMSGIDKPESEEDRLEKAAKLELLVAKLQNKQPKQKRLTPQNILKVNEGNAIPLTLNRLENSIDKNKDLFGPVMGRLGQLNPYNTKAQSYDSEIRAASQQFGRYMEGGVLRKEDEEKYRAMFPNLSDTPEVAKNKLENVKTITNSQQQLNLDALNQQGFDITGLTMPAQTPKKEVKRINKTTGRTEVFDADTKQHIRTE